MGQPTDKASSPGGLLGAYAKTVKGLVDDGATYVGNGIGYAYDKAAELLADLDRSPANGLESRHYYATRNQVIPCAVNNAQIRDMARRFAVPGHEGKAFVSGKQTTADVAGRSDPVTAFFYDGGDYPTGVATTMNRTEKEHIFHKGTVDRQWFRGPDGSVWAETTGRGSNSGPGIAGMNAFSGPKIFNSLDQSARDYALKYLCRR